MNHPVLPIPFKPPRLIGFSEDLLDSHYKQAYGAAVRALNEMAPNGENYLSALNTVTLFEIFFESLGGEDGLGSPTAPPTGPLSDQIAQDFVSFETWARSFRALAAETFGGWVALIWERRRRRLVNIRIPSPSAGLIDGLPLLVIDMSLQAHSPEFRDDTSRYVDTFMVNIHWGRAQQSFGSRPSGRPNESLSQNTVAAEDLRTLLSGDQPPVVLDICLDEDMAKRSDKIPGALICPPAEIDTWSKTLPKGRAVVGYCVYGYQVSSDAVARLRALGLDAKQLAGGIAAWHAMGGETEKL